MAVARLGLALKVLPFSKNISQSYLALNAVHVCMRSTKYTDIAARKDFHTASYKYGSGVLKEGEDCRSLTKDDWRKRLTDEQFNVCREKGTEAPYSGHLEVGEGVYACVCCGSELFSSSSKFDSGCGWPAFHTSIRSGSNHHVIRKEDRSYGMVRIEVMCEKCGSHLGHVFSDGPRPSGERYCINSVALEFHQKKSE